MLLEYPYMYNMCTYLHVYPMFRFWCISYLLPSCTVLVLVCAKQAELGLGLGFGLGLVLVELWISLVYERAHQGCHFMLTALFQLPYVYTLQVLHSYQEFDSRLLYWRFLCMSIWVGI